MILYFTGTGNSRAVAYELGRRLGDESIIAIEGTLASAPADASLSLSEGEKRVVWVFPTYSWGVPPVVARVIRSVRAADGFAHVCHYMVTTCGDDMGRADGIFRRLIGGRGWKAAREAFSVIMPNTYTLMKGFDVDSPDVANSKIAAMPARVSEIAARICSADPEGSLLTRGSFPGIKTGIIFPWFKKFAMSPKPFRFTDACTACGLCARKCPLGNITMSADGPQWADNCALCLRCYHICPRHAVAYGTATDGKGQYLFPTRE